MNILRHTGPSLGMSILSPLTRTSAFQHEMNRLFELPIFDRESNPSDGWSPALDLFQGKDDLFVKVELSGLKKEDIKLSLHDGVLTLSGERRRDETQDGKNLLLDERFSGHFERAIALPIQVDGTRVTASYEAGILTVTLPKAEAAKPRQIEIGVK